MSKLSSLLTIALVSVAVLLCLYFVLEVVKYEVYFHFVDSVASKTGLNMYLVYAIAALCLAPFMLAVGYSLSLFSRRRRRLGATILLGMAFLYNLGLYFATKGTSFAFDSGRPTRYYAITPDGIKYSDRPGFEPTYGIAFKAVTPDDIRRLKRIEREPFRRVDPASADWFDSITGDPLLWYCRSAEGVLEFYSRPGYHTRTREPLKPVTKEIYEEWSAQEKAKAAVPRSEPNQEPAQTVQGTAPPATPAPPEPAALQTPPLVGEPAAASQEAAQTVQGTAPSATPTPAEPAGPQMSPVARPRLSRTILTPHKPRTVTLLAGTRLSVRLAESLSSDRNQPGERFLATLDQPLVVEGLVIAGRGARVEGRLFVSERGGRVMGASHLAIRLQFLETSDGQRVRIETDTFEVEGPTSRGRDAAKVAIGAGLGAAIGAIAGGGKGAAVGAAAGGTAGTGTVIATRGKPAVLPAETRIVFRLREPVTLTERLR